VDINKVHHWKRAAVNTVTIIQKREENNNVQVRRLLQLDYMFEANKTLDVRVNPAVLKKGTERKKMAASLVFSRAEMTVNSAGV